MTVFGPIYPLLLSVGGASLFWARIVGVVAFGASACMVFYLLRERANSLIGAAGAIAFGASVGLIRVASTVWSEMPYIAISLVSMAVVCRKAPSRRILVLAGVAAGCGFLTRYAGVGLILAGGVALAMDGGVSARQRWRRAVVFLFAAGVPISVWVVRNLIRSGEALGPRFEGGTTEDAATLFRRPLRAVGELLLGERVSAHQQDVVGLAAIGFVLASTTIAIGRSPTRRRPMDIAMGMYGLGCVLVPLIARTITSNDIEFRVMSPFMVSLVYFAALAVGSVARTSTLRALGVAALVWWMVIGVGGALHFPDRLAGSAGSRQSFSAELYDVIDQLDPLAQVLTNSPQRVWWQSRREPILFAFTRARPGNSHYPLSAAETLQQACTGNAYLAWFDRLQNAGQGPEERRPDLVAAIELRIVREVSGGTLFALAPRSRATCAP